MNVRKMSGFGWTPKRHAAAVGLGIGRKQEQVAEEVGVSDRTIRRWLQAPEFAAEVDRLTLESDIAAKARRLRIVKRLARQRIDRDGYVHSNADLLDILKFAKSETDGLKLGLIGRTKVIGGGPMPARRVGAVVNGLLPCGGVPIDDCRRCGNRLVVGEVDLCLPCRDPDGVPF